MDNEEKILRTAEKLFVEMGLKFTLDDISKELHMAKKTIYKSYSSKENLLNAMVENGFEKIQKNKKKILESDIDLIDKIKSIMIAMPDRYTVFDFRELETLKEKYPDVYRNLQRHLESDWEPVIKLLEEGMEKGYLKQISIPVLKIMVTSTLESYLSTSILKDEKISYNDALKNMMDIIMKGIEK